MRFTIPIKTVSEANQREHHMAKHRRKKQQQTATIICMRQVFRPMRLPLVVSMTRICPTSKPRFLDDDNLAGSFKHCRDAIAMELGINDGDTKRITFKYAQKSQGDDYGVVIEIESNDQQPDLTLADAAAKKTT